MAQEGKLISVEKIQIPDKLRIRDSAVKKIYYGAIQSQKELEEIWSKLYDVHNEFSFFMNLNTNKESVPIIDFNNYMVLWYANQGSGASFVKSIEVLEESDKVVVRVGLFYSDFGSNNLNLWKMPKISKEVIFEETREHEIPRGP